MRYRMLDLLLAGPPPRTKLPTATIDAVVGVMLEHGMVNVLCATGSIVSETLATFAGLDTTKGPCPDASNTWDAVGKLVTNILIGASEFAREHAAELEAKSEEINVGQN